MNRNCPDDGDEDERDVEPLGGSASAITAIKQVTADVHVEEQVAIQDQDVPAQHRGREVELADAGDEVPEAVGPAEVNGHESQAHEDGSDGEQLAEDHEVVQLLVFVNVNRD